MTESVAEGVLKRKDCRHCKRPFEYIQVGRHWRLICDDCGPSPGGQENKGIGKKRRNLAHRYGITIAEYMELSEACEGMCESCGAKPDALAVDHDHETGEVRGMLCRGCNIALGHLGDDPNRISGLLGYILSRGT